MKIKADVESFYEAKKSRFYGYLHRVSSESEVKDFLKTIRKAHPDARHVCYAFRVDNIERSSDDGEPAGTAGHPMLQTLQKHNLEDILIVVVRYFGGTLLGTGGLVKAYTTTLTQALDEAVYIESRKVPLYQLELDYALSGKIEPWLRMHGEILECQYGDKALYTFIINDSELNLDDNNYDPNIVLASLSKGRAKARMIDTVEMEVEVSKPH